MATISSGVSGPWSSPSTWTGGVVPGSGDNAILAGHTVTLDQDATVNDLSSTGAGRLELVGSSPRELTLTGALKPSTTATTQSMILFGGDYSAEGTEFNINSVLLGAHTGSTMTGVFTFSAGCTGSVSVVIDSLSGDTSSTGNEPDIFRFEPSSGTHLNLELNSSIVQNLSYIVLMYGTTGQITSNVTIDFNANFSTSAEGSILVGRSYIGTLTINGSGVLTSSQTIVTITAGAVATDGYVNVVFNMDLPEFGVSRLIAGGARSIVTINSPIYANVVNYISSVSELILNESVTVNDAVATGNIITASLVRVNSDVTALGKMRAITATGVAIVGSPSSNRVHRLISVEGGQPIKGTTHFFDDNEYEMVFADDSNLPDTEGSPVTLRHQGGGPRFEDTRQGTVYPTGVAGKAIVPPYQSVRAGVPVDDTAGEALLDSADLANITGSQIAELSE